MTGPETSSIRVEWLDLGCSVPGLILGSSCSAGYSLLADLAVTDVPVHPSQHAGAELTRSAFAVANTRRLNVVYEVCPCSQAACARRRKL